MIKALRVDERLVHGQIAMLWSKELGLDGIVVANDSAAADDMQKMVLKMAVPEGIKIIIKSVDDSIQLLKNPKAQKMKLLVIVRTIADALSIASQLTDIEYVNIGNVGKASGGTTRTLSKNVMINESEEVALKKLVEKYPDTSLQVVPSDPRVRANEFV